MQKILFYICLFLILCNPVFGADYFAQGKLAFEQKKYAKANDYYNKALIIFMLPSSSGLRCRPLTAESGVRIPLGVPEKMKTLCLLFLSPKGSMQKHTNCEAIIRTGTRS